jgi:hypothetical protein
MLATPSKATEMIMVLLTVMLTFGSAFTHFSQKSLSIAVWTALDIEPGEEITISCPYSLASVFAYCQVH